MCGPIQEQKEKKIEEVKHETLRETLTSLQTWDLAEGQTLEERRQAHRESLIHGQLQENAALQNAARAQLNQATANAAAPGAPVQEQAPAQLTYKQRREQARKAREARRHCPIGTADTYDIQKGVSEVIQYPGNSIEPFVAEAVEKDVDLRVLRTFSKGYKQNRRGRPATPEDQAAADSDNAFLTDYLSLDVKRREPHLERFRKELIDFPLSADTISDANIVRNAAQLKKITDRGCYYENIMRDPINKPYFDSLDPTELDLLTAKLETLAQVGSYCVNRMGAIGVNCNLGEYYDITEAPASHDAIAQMQREPTTQLAAGWAQQKQAILERHMEEDAAQERESMLRKISEDQAKQTTQRPEDMNFSSPAAGYATEELKRYRAMIEEHPDVYAANKPLIDQLYQELYRGLDVLNDMAFDSMVYQGVFDKKKESQKGTDQAKASLAFKKLERYMESMDTARKRLNAISHSLDFYLKEKPLTDDARALLSSMGKEKEAAFLEGKHAVKHALEGEDGALAKANAAYKNGNNLNAGLTALGARTSTSAYAKADKLLRGSTYIGYGDQMVAFVHKLEDEDHVDMSTVMEQATQKYTSGMGGGVAGGPIDAINLAMLRNFSDYLKGEESIRYIQTLAPMLKGADMFGNSIDGAVAYVVQSLFNSYGANFTYIGSQTENFAGGENTAAVVKNACRTLMSLSSLERRGDAENNDLPEATKGLLRDYKQLLKDLKDKAFPPDAPNA